MTREEYNAAQGCTCSEAPAWECKLPRCPRRAELQASWDYMYMQHKVAQRDCEIASHEARWQAWYHGLAGRGPEPKRNPYHTIPPQGCNRGRYS